MPGRSLHVDFPALVSGVCKRLTINYKGKRIELQQRRRNALLADGERRLAGAHPIISHSVRSIHIFRINALNSFICSVVAVRRRETGNRNIEIDIDRNELGNIDLVILVDGGRGRVFLVHGAALGIGEFQPETVVHACGNIDEHGAVLEADSRDALLAGEAGSVESAD